MYKLFFFFFFSFCHACNCQKRILRANDEIKRSIFIIIQTILVHDEQSRIKILHKQKAKKKIEILQDQSSLRIAFPMVLFLVAYPKNSSCTHRVPMFSPGDECGLVARDLDGLVIRRSWIQILLITTWICFRWPRIQFLHAL